MRSVLIFLVFPIFWCNANSYLCQYYDENSKSLEIYCGQTPKLRENCTREIPSLNSLDVIRLKIEGCYHSGVNEKSAGNLNSFDVSYSGYRSVDWSIHARVSIIEFDGSFNQLSAIPKTILRKYRKLETINLAYNYLKHIFNGDFKNGKKLRKINLSHNMLESIEINAFANLKHLQLINLKDNQFSTLPLLNDLYASVIDIEDNPQLSLFNCFPISIIHKSTFFLRFSWEYIKSFYGDSNCGRRKFNVDKMYELEGVYIAQPPLGQIDLICNNKSFQNIQYFVAGAQTFRNVNDMLNLLGSSVLKIDVSGNGIGELDANVFKRFRLLRKLSLSNTGLTKMDINVLTNLKYLNRLDISQNHLKRIDNSILLQYFGHLIDLNAAGNRIENTDEIIRFLPTTMRQLNLAGSQMNFTNAFSTIGRLTALEYLNLSDTNLSILDANPFVPFRHLRSLDLSYNDLSNVNFTAALNTSNQLREFRAANSQIANVTPIIGNLNVSLQILDLSGNHIGPMFDESLLRYLGNLTHLNLSATNLRKFDLETIKPLKWLQSLDVSHNQLESFDLTPLPSFKQLKRLYLNDNDLTKLDNFAPYASPFLSLAIARNQFPCAYLRQLKHEHPNVNYIHDWLNQKHSNDCRSSTQAISDFLNNVYDAVKFW